MEIMFWDDEDNKWILKLSLFGDWRLDEILECIKQQYNGDMTHWKKYLKGETK